MLNNERFETGLLENGTIFTKIFFHLNLANFCDIFKKKIQIVDARTELQNDTLNS